MLMFYFMKVLIIDNNRNITNLISDFLTAKGIENIVTNNPKDGLECIKNEKYDAVLLDILMPEFNGVDIIEALEREKILKDQRIFIFSAISTSYSIKRLIKKEGIKGCLIKPMPLKEMYSTIVC